MDLSIPSSTWAWLSAIAILWAVCIGLVFYFKKKNKLIDNRRIVEYFPTFVSTLGVLGTFYGITVGLLDFDTNNLDQSIPGLLDGLKTAFFTSLAGMIGSMILSGLISKKQDEAEGGVSDIQVAAGQICTAVKEMSELNKTTIEQLTSQMAEQEKDRKAFYRSMGAVMDNIKATQNAIAQALASIQSSQSDASSSLDSLVILQRSQEATLTTLKEASQGMASSIGNLEENSASQMHSLQTIATSSKQTAEAVGNVNEILDVISTMAGTQDEINEQVQNLKTILDAEVDQIEKSMQITNELLERKFDEFTELLKKSNTEALVEVMKRVTEEFQKQMNALINKLIQENFDQLNKSVEKLNQWQQENKEMIASLTRQYQQMANNFEATSTSLMRVKEDTAQLVSEGGKLRQLVDALNEVIIKDQKFIQLTNDLQKTAELSKSNMESFDSSTRALNEWVRKQRNFVDGVQMLIDKLEELNKLKDYNEQFWQGTKRSLEEGLNIIKTGSTTLNARLVDLDKSYYQRLGTTLSELDACIQAMIKGRR